MASGFSRRTRSSVGAAGWAGIEVGRRYMNAALNRTTGDIRTVAEVMVGTAEDSLHLWLNITLVVGAGLVVLGVVASMLGGVLRRTTADPSPGTATHSR